VTHVTRTLPCGDSAVLVETDDVAALYATLRRDPVPGQLDLVPAARTLLVRFDPEKTDRVRVGAALSATTPAAGEQTVSGAEVTIPVVYDGEDLHEVAELAGLTPAQVVAAHTGAAYTVAFIGFAPGFAYLTGGDTRLDVPRRDNPRTRVPAGSVAVAGGYSAVYPRESPGGWRLLGRTDAVVWDLDRDPPALLIPGTRVRFVDAT
jgi:KipI family sensor histidine kinase inhibitor